MKKYLLSFSISLSMVFVICSSFAQTTDLGEIDFPTSGIPEAQTHFIQGVLLLHSFEYQDARHAFKKAQEIDPEFAMAHWGEAMTHNHPIWNQQDREAALAALGRLAPSWKKRLAKAPSYREKDYLQTLEVLFGEGDKLSRDFAYSEAMKKLSEKNPDDLEAKSFYALSILGTAQGKRDFRTYIKAGAIAGGVFEKNPRHPGAAHYVIHSFDDPIHAPLGLRAAQVYAEIAPDAPHALHMPSHIFMALGMWDQAVALNKRSAAASRKKGGHGLHATWWLAYSYLQQGRHEKTREIIQAMENLLAGDTGHHVRNHMAYIRSEYLVETRRWHESILNDFDIAGLRLRASGSVLLARGMQAVSKGEIAKAEKLLAEMKALPHASARYSDTETSVLMEKELEALIHFNKGNSDKALFLLEEAEELQDNMTFEFGPTMPVKPVFELYGEILLKLNRPHEAREKFKKSLAREPRRALSLLGLARSAKAAGDVATSYATYAELKKVWSKADSDVAELAEVNAHLKKFSSR